MTYSYIINSVYSEIYNNIIFYGCCFPLVRTYRYELMKSDVLSNYCRWIYYNAYTMTELKSSTYFCSGMNLYSIFR